MPVSRIGNPTYALANVAGDFSVCQSKKTALYARAWYNADIFAFEENVKL